MAFVAQRVVFCCSFFCILNKLFRCDVFSVFGIMLCRHIPNQDYRTHRLFNSYGLLSLLLGFNVVVVVVWVYFVYELSMNSFFMY